MEAPVMYFLGFIMCLVACIIYGLWASNKVHDESVDYTLECPCGSVDFTEKETFYICKDCATKISK